MEERGAAISLEEEKSSTTGSSVSNLYKRGNGFHCFLFSYLLYDLAMNSAPALVAAYGFVGSSVWSSNIGAWE